MQHEVGNTAAFPEQSAGFHVPFAPCPILGLLTSEKDLPANPGDITIP